MQTGAEVRQSRFLGTSVTQELQRKSESGLKFFLELPISLAKLAPNPVSRGGPMGSVASVLSAAPQTAAAVNELMVDVGFSTTIGGKTYVADVTYSGGEYIASDSNVTGAMATGSSLATAEDNLTTRIDVLV
jgi:hypothetical protein